MANDKATKKRSENPDRLIISPAVMTVLKNRLAQIQEEFGGGIKIHARDLALLILELRSGPLNETELVELKNRHYDEIKATEWAIQQVKKARSKGENLTLNQLMKKFNSPRVIKNHTSKPANKVTKLSDTDGDVQPTSNDVSKVL